jgi:lipoprotein-releasing system permease protein
MAGPLPDTAPFAGFERMLALRYLRAHRKEGFISVISLFSFLGIMLGVATLITVMAVMNGFRTELLTKILGFSGHATIVSADRAPIADFAGLSVKLAEIPEVTRVIPFVEGQVLATSLRSNNGVLIRGVRESDLKQLSSVNNDKLVTAMKDPGTPDEQAALDGFDTSEGIAVGRRLADRHLLGLGSGLTLVAPEGPETIMGSVPRSRDFTVVAIFEMGMSQYDDGVIFMPIADAQEFLASEAGVSAIEVMVSEPDAIAGKLPAMRAVLGDGYSIGTWQGRNKEFFEALATERIVMFFILSLIVLVAALNIISGMIMLVKDKGHSIAILRTMGATQSAVMRVFMMTGSTIGIAGTAAGVALGLIVAMNVHHIAGFISWLTGVNVFDPTVRFLAQLPSDVDPAQVLWTALMALTLSVLATIYPSWQAARLDPVEALRYE